MQRWRSLVMVAVFALVSVVGVSAQDATPAAEDCADLTDADVAAVLAAFHDGPIDSEEIVTVLDEDVHSVSPFAGLVVGPVAVAGYHDELASIFSGLSYDPAGTVLVDDPYIVVPFRFVGDHTGEFLGIPATGAHVDISALRVYRMECGKVVDFWTASDQMARMAQMGVLSEEWIPETVASPEVPADCAPPSEQEVADLVRDYWATGFNSKGAGFADVVSPNYVHHWSSGQDANGLEAFLARFNEWPLAFPDLTFTHGEIIIDGDMAATVWTATGTDAGSGFRGNAPTGLKVSWSGINLFHVACGKIVESWSEGDIASLQRQVSSGT